MNKFLLVIFSVLFSISVGYAQSYQPPEEYRGIKWGTNVNELTDMVVLARVMP